MAICGASMMRLQATGIVLVLSLSTLTYAEEPQRWSRQISNTNFLNDWVPVQPNQPAQPPQPVQSVRQPSGRVLNFGPPFQQPQSLQQQQQHQSPFGATIFHNNVPQAPAGVSFAHESFPHRLMFHHQSPNVQFVQQSPVAQAQSGVPPFLVNGVLPQMLIHGPQALQQQPHIVQHPQPPHPEQRQNFQYPQFGAAVNQAPVQPQPASTPQTHASFLGDVSSPVQPYTEQLVQNIPSSVPQVHSNGVERQIKPKGNNKNREQDEVQLLYVPLDTLYQQQRDKVQNTKYNVLPHPVNPLQINNLYSGPTPTALPFGSPSSPSPSSSPTPHNLHRYSTPAFKETSGSRLKPHQPPLAMFMLNDGKSRGSVSDVLSTLANANSIDVLDSASKKSPKVFVGPSGLNTPDGYTKFELPYLSNIEQTRLERQIDKLPFFVAPLSYRAPKGFAKIPLPAPHVGSVVVNSITDDGAKPQQDNYQPTKAYYSDSPAQYYTTPKENMQYITIPSPSPLPNSQVRSTTAGYTPGKYNFGFSFGADDFTTTPRPNIHFSSTPAYVTQDAEFTRPKSPSTRQPQRNSRPSSAAVTGSIPLLHSTRDEPTQIPTDSSFSPQQNSEIFSYKPFPSTPNVNEEYFNVNKNTPTFSFANFPANGTSITTQVFGSTDEGIQSPSFGSFINHYGSSTPNAEDFYTSSLTTTRAPTQAKYSFPSVFDETVGTTSKPRPSTTRAQLPPAPTVLPIDNEYSTQADGITKPKSYYKGQDTFKSRVSTSPPPQVYETESYETIGYNPVSSTPSFLQDTVLYNRDRNTPTTEGYLQTNPPTTPRTTFTYYTASSIDDEDTSGIQPVVNHKYVDSVIRNKENSTPNTRTRTNDYVNSYTSSQDSQRNESPKYKNTYDNYYRPAVNHQQSDEYSSPATTPSYYEPTRNDYRGDKLQTDEYTSPKYQLPSELPPISPNLPGLVNALMDKNKNVVVTSTTSVPPTTRRGPTRGRRPQTARTTTSSPSSDDEGAYVEITTRRNPTRTRRPVPTYASSNRTSTSRTPVTRNSQRVRYNPNSEERQRYHTRTRTTSENGSSKRPKEEENIDYQRDVLKQNYPVINREDRTITSTTERLAEFSDPGVIYHTSVRPADLPTSADISSNTLADQFAALQDGMQIPQQYQGLNKEIDVHEISNYPPVFFSRDTPVAQEHQQESQSSSAQVKSTERTVVITPTTQAPVQTETTQPEINTEVLRTRRPSFIRRPPTTASTTVTTTSTPTTTQEYEMSKTREKYQPRTKPRYETNSSQARLKPRVRGRRPTTETPTTVPNFDEESTSETKPYRKVNRYNKDLYKDHSQNKRPAKESSSIRATISPAQEQKKSYLQRQSSRFSLDTEESQWSSKLGQNSFQPVNPDDESKSSNGQPEPEIVTAGYGDSQTQETYTFNVAAKNVFGSNNEGSTLKVGLPDPSSTPSTSESSIADLIKAAISDFSNDIPSNSNDESESDEEHVTTTAKLDTTSASARSDILEKKGRRRGVWKRVRVRPIDGFETAESQNIGKQIYNTILSDNTKETFDKGTVNSYQSYELSKENKGFVEETNEEATIVPSPGDIDLGTGAPGDVLTNGTFRDLTTTEKTEINSTQEPDVTTTLIQENDEKEVSETEVTIAPTEIDYKIKDEAPSTTSVAADTDKETAQPTESNDSVEEQPKWTEATNTEANDEESSKSEEQIGDMIIDDQDPQSSIYMDEVRQKLSSLFSFPDEPAPTKELGINKNFKRSRGPSYSTIERTRAAAANELESTDKEKIQPSPMKLRPVTVEKTILHPIQQKGEDQPPVTESSFHRDLMDSVIYATSTSTEVSHETEICYRGRCVKSVRKP